MAPTTSILGFLQESVAAAVSGGVLIAIVAYLLRSWITERLKNAIAHEYNRDLEAHKNHLAAISAARAEGQKAAIEFRYAGFDRLWKAMLHVRNSTGLYLTSIDIITEQEYASFEKMKILPGLLDDLDDAKFLALAADENIEEVRPYVGEVVWSYWWIYQAFNLRSVHLAQKSRRNPQRKEYWLRDNAIRSMLKSVLRKDEMEQLDALEAGGIAFVRSALESRVIASWGKLITGEQFGKEVDDARERLAAAEKVQAKSDALNRLSGSFSATN